MKRSVNLFFTLVFLLSLTNSVWAQYTVDKVPNQKLIDNSYVSNPDGILDAVTVAQINSNLTALEQATTVQVSVVAIRSIGDAVVFDFAQELFNKWGIGNKGNDNGLLVLLVEDQHEIRFHTGLGVEGVLSDATCKRIQREYMVPEFRKGDYNTAMIQGVRQISKVLTDPAYAEELRTPEESTTSDYVILSIFLLFTLGLVVVGFFFAKQVTGKFSDSKKPAPTAYPEMRLSRWTWLTLYGIIPGLILALLAYIPTPESAAFCLFGLYGYLMITLLTRLWRMQKVISRFKAGRAFYDITVFLKKEQIYWLVMGILFPPFILYFFYHLFRKRFYRNHPRNCQACTNEMRKLDERADDAFLSESQLMEEDLRAVDYDVWQCTNCHVTEIWNYPNRFSKYKECPSCKTRAFYLVSSHTVVRATYTSSGRGEELRTCKFCGHKKKSSYTIAQLTRSSSSSSSSGGSSSGSWGGGSSGGGGASSRW